MIIFAIMRKRLTPETSCVDVTLLEHQGAASLSKRAFTTALRGTAALESAL
jgi:hypothetical protein